MAKNKLAPFFPDTVYILTTGSQTRYNVLPCMRVYLSDYMGFSLLQNP